MQHTSSSCTSPCIAVIFPHEGLRRFCQQPLRSYSCLLEGSDHFESDAMHTLTDLHRTSCPPPLLASLQGLMRQLCFAFLLLQKAILTQISGVFLILLLVLYREEPEALVRALWPTATMATKNQLQVYRSSTGDPFLHFFDSDLPYTYDLVSSHALLLCSRQTSSVIFPRSSFNFCLPSASSLSSPFS